MHQRADGARWKSEQKQNGSDTTDGRAQGSLSAIGKFKCPTACSRQAAHCPIQSGASVPGRPPSHPTSGPPLLAIPAHASVLCRKEDPAGGPRPSDSSKRGVRMVLRYRPRRVHCRHCRVHAEAFPWAEGWARVTRALAGAVVVLARSQRWQETARAYGLNWRGKGDRLNGAVFLGSSACGSALC